jgi:hypothetical protein
VGHPVEQDGSANIAVDLMQLNQVQVEQRRVDLERACAEARDQHDVACPCASVELVQEGQPAGRRDERVIEQNHDRASLGLVERGHRGRRGIGNAGRGPPEPDRDAQPVRRKIIRVLEQVREQGPRIAVTHRAVRMPDDMHRDRRAVPHRPPVTVVRTEGSRYRTGAGRRSRRSRCDCIWTASRPP